MLRFLAPNFLIGFFIALSNENRPAPGFQSPISDPVLKLGLVAFGVALFTLVAEVRKLFFTGGDLESFYFVQPAKISRLASLLAAITLDFAIVFSVVAPFLLITLSGPYFLKEIFSACIIVVCISLTFYLLIVFAIASLPQRSADLSLTILQILMVLMLLAVFQLPLGVGLLHGTLLFSVSCLCLPAFCLVFLAFPFQEKLISKLSRQQLGTRLDFVSVIERMKRFVIIRSKEEEAGFIFFLSNLFRNSSLRLSTIGTAATPIMVAVYWSMRGFHYLNFDTASSFFQGESVAPLASLIISGIFVYYYLSQNILSSKDHEAKWMISQAMSDNEGHHGADAGKFMIGVRKSFMLAVHVPVAILIFFVIIIKEPFVPALVSTLTFYLLTHVAASWFFVMLKRLPFSLPFTQIGSIELLGIVSTFVYSFLIIIVLYFCYGSLQNILAMDFSAFILTGMLEIFSAKIVKRRMKFV